MGMFQHPHLIRGIVRTPQGAFVVSRGLVELPDELGESLGWRPAESADDTPPTASRSLPISCGPEHRAS
jgi:hypothetical protein